MALGYREHAKQFEAKNTVIYGINDKGVQSSREWIEKEKLPFRVLLDPDRAVGISYGMSDAEGERYVSNPSDGRRPAVVISEEGRILAFEPDMNSVEQIEHLLVTL